MIAETILQMRIYALYHRNKVVVIVMLVTFLACSTASATIMGISLKGAKGNIPTFFGGLKNAESTQWFQRTLSIYLTAKYAFPVYLIGSFECLLCCMVAIHGYRTYRDSRIVVGFGAFRVFHHERLSDILVRDSLLYFISIGAVYTACLVVWILDTVTSASTFYLVYDRESLQNFLIEAPAGFSIALSSVLACRLILNLRQVNEVRAVRYPFIVGSDGANTTLGITSS
ncbi:hypothetical protein CVT26_008693 [Gymnopilus dilepis]|uniref:Uncharacterized protein n=1 Tax=Gymnopilus dilepis TaxID=231916 RepID=A0A409W9P3_9AGAR|nr:hypothetical protein CVT26_008693 [Gymnopilus dilepis]